jgi:glycosyltransferase involved in cell wall biosynthesis
MKISIITVCKNCKKTIERSVLSVLNQSYRDIEYIVIDGKSVDGTIEILRRYHQGIDILISENDFGIYNAMNKAVAYSSGEILYFLNSDDYFHDNEVVCDVVRKFESDANINVVFGNVIMINNNECNLVKYDDINDRYFYKNTICHQALFIRSKTFKEIGNYDEKYKIHADTDWLLKAYFKNKKMFKYYNRNISYFSYGGLCSNPITANKYKFDRQRISAKFFFKAKYKLIIKKIFCKLGYKRYSNLSN